jgi:hypothetical protein
MLQQIYFIFSSLPFFPLVGGGSKLNNGIFVFPFPLLPLVQAIKHRQRQQRRMLVGRNQDVFEDFEAIL